MLFFGLFLLCSFGAAQAQGKSKYKKQRHFRVLDFSNISGSRSIHFSAGTATVGSFDELTFSTGALHFGKIVNNKGLFLGGVRYLADKQEEFHHQFFLGEGTYSYYLLTLSRFIDFRAECSLAMGIAAKDDKRTGNENHYYALGLHPGVGVSFKFNTYFYIAAKASIISLYDTKTLNTYPLASVAVILNL